MGYSYRNNGQIKDYWPDDTDTTIYLESSYNYTLAGLYEKAKEKWPEALLSDIEIAAEKIHTECLTYDQYDSSDYTDFIVLTYRK